MATLPKTIIETNTCLSTQLVGHDNPNQAHPEIYSFEEATAEKESRYETKTILIYLCFCMYRVDNVQIKYYATFRP